MYSFFSNTYVYLCIYVSFLNKLACWKCKGIFHISDKYFAHPLIAYHNPKNHMVYVSFTGTPAAVLEYEFILHVDTEKAGRL